MARSATQRSSKRPDIRPQPDQSNQKQPPCARGWVHIREFEFNPLRRAVRSNRGSHQGRICEVSREFEFISLRHKALYRAFLGIDLELQALSENVLILA